MATHAAASAGTASGTAVVALPLLAAPVAAASSRIALATTSAAPAASATAQSLASTFPTCPRSRWLTHPCPPWFRRTTGFSCRHDCSAEHCSRRHRCPRRHLSSHLCSPQGSAGRGPAHTPHRGARGERPQCPGQSRQQPSVAAGQRRGDARGLDLNASRDVLLRSWRTRTRNAIMETPNAVRGGRRAPNES